MIRDLRGKILNQFFSTLLDTSIRTFDSVILSINSSAYSVGIYQRAINMRNLGHTFAFTPNQLLFYPKISREETLKAKSSMFMKFVQTNFMYAIPVSLIAIFCAKEWTVAIFGPQWQDSAILIQILAASIPFKAIDSELDMLAKALNQQSQTIRLRISIALLYFGCILFFSFFSLLHVAISALCVFMLSSVFSAIKCYKILQQQINGLKSFLTLHIVYFIVLSLSGLFLLEAFEEIFGLLVAGPILGMFSSVIYILLAQKRFLKIHQ